MGFLDLFGKDKVTGTKVLVCAIGSRFDDLVRQDAEIYRYFYPATTTAKFSDVQELVDSLSRQYDIVHIFCDVSAAGCLNESPTTGTEIIAKCCDCNVKLLWFASDNPGEGYMKGFNARGKPINLVMTLDRKGEKFSGFLEKLLGKTSQGLAMPVAWNQLCPQIPGTEHLDAPDSIFFAGRGGVRLR